MKPRGEAKVLDKLFVHYSNMIDPPPKRNIKNGHWIQCRVSKDEEHTNFMAVDINSVPRPQSHNASLNNPSSSSGGGNSRPRKQNRQQRASKKGPHGKASNGGSVTM